MKKLLASAIVLALPGAAGASPQVSGDGACGIRALDNESFLTCSDDRAPPPTDPVDVLGAGPLPTIPTVAASTRVRVVAPAPMSQTAITPRVGRPGLSRRAISAAYLARWARRPTWPRPGPR